MAHLQAAAARQNRSEPQTPNLSDESLACDREAFVPGDHARRYALHVVFTRRTGVVRHSYSGLLRVYLARLALARRLRRPSVGTGSTVMTHQELFDK